MSLHRCACVYYVYTLVCAYWSSWCEWKDISLICVCCRVSGAMANASPDLDNAEAQCQLNNNNRPIGSGFWETECTSSKLFECSRIKALAGQRFTKHILTHRHSGISRFINTPTARRVYVLSWLRLTFRYVSINVKNQKRTINLVYGFFLVLFHPTNPLTQILICFDGKAVLNWL